MTSASLMSCCHAIFVT